MIELADDPEQIRAECDARAQELADYCGGVPRKQWQSFWGWLTALPLRMQVWQKLLEHHIQTQQPRRPALTLNARDAPTSEQTMRQAARWTQILHEEADVLPEVKLAEFNSWLWCNCAHYQAFTDIQVALRLLRKQPHAQGRRFWPDPDLPIQ